jgi:coenzyme F420-reducing hydrogenase alpha subunit
LTWALDFALATVKFTSTLTFPDFEQDYEFVSLRHPDEYPLFDGRFVSNKGIDIAIDEYPQYFEEQHVAHSTSLHSVVKARGAYHVGPLARYSLNFDKLPEIARKAAKKAGLKETCYNPFKSIIVRAVETVFACHEALRIISEYKMPEKPFVEVTPKAAVGHGASEAPRGTLYHRYRIGADGLIQEARIVPPTSQNQKVIESDLAAYVGKHLKLSEEKLTWQCEQVVRNYDPCISCSCHFLKLHIDRQ